MLLMDSNLLSNLIKSGESDILEFKKSTSQLKEAVMTLCGFLNHQGGSVLIGINNNGQILGQEISDNTRQEIARELSKVEPPVNINIQYKPLPNNKYLIIMQTPAGAHAPYVYDGRPFQRMQSTTSKMPQHRYEQMLVKRGQLNHVWEEAVVGGYSITSLDQEEILRTVTEGVRENRIPASALKENVEEVLQRMGLIWQGQIKRAAIVLFAKEIFPAFPQCMIKMARFQGTNKLGDFIDNQHIYANAFKILSEADIFLRRHLPIASNFSPNQLKRTDIPALPVLAIREALINAICHRDYANRSASISLAIYDDRLELWNNGSLPHELNIEALKNRHDSLPRNKLISKVFHARGYIETWGTGTNKMIEVCHQANLPEPDFEEYSGGFAVQFRFQKSLATKTPATNQEEQISNNLAAYPRLERIFTLLEEQKGLSATEIRILLSEPLAERTLRKDLATLKKMGFINSKGQARAKRWYRVKN